MIIVNSDLEKFLDWNGNISIPYYLYRMIMALMKESLDLGTLLSDDQAKLRAYKERVKNVYHQEWKKLASIFEEMGLIEPCGCDVRKKCDICKGSRYVTSSFLNADRIIEHNVILASKDDDKTQEALLDSSDRKDALS